MNSVSVIPAIIPQDFDDLREHLARLSDQKVRDALGVPARVQIDIMDGVFAPTESWPFVGSSGEFEDIVDQEKGLPFWELFDFEIDVMVEEPEKHVENWIRAGASSLIIHASSTNQHVEIREILDHFNIKMGIAFLPSDDKDHKLVKMADFVQLMGSDKIGYHGVDLDMKIYADIVTLRKAFPDIDIAVDIGVDDMTSPRLIEAGVNKLVSGSYIFDSIDISQAINILKEEN